MWMCLYCLKCLNGLSWFWCHGYHRDSYFVLDWISDLSTEREDFSVKVRCCVFQLWQPIISLLQILQIQKYIGVMFQCPYFALPWLAPSVFCCSVIVLHLAVLKLPHRSESDEVIAV